MSQQKYFKYWGKTDKKVEGESLSFHLLPHHCLDVAAVANIWWQKSRFFLTANPTKRIRAKGGKKSNQGRCRVPLIDENELLDWLTRKFVNVGRLHEVIITAKNNLYFRKKGQPGKIVTIDYTGLLSVNYVESLTNLVEKGVGPAKAFGCGLFSLTRA